MIVEFLGSDDGVGEWKCSKDVNDGCTHKKTAHATLAALLGRPSVEVKKSAEYRADAQGALHTSAVSYLLTNRGSSGRRGS